MKRLFFTLALAVSSLLSADAFANGGAQRIVVRQRAPLIARQRVVVARPRVVVARQRIVVAPQAYYAPQAFVVAPQAYYQPQAIVVQQPALGFYSPPQVESFSVQSFSTGGCAEFFSY